MTNNDDFEQTSDYFLVARIQTGDFVAVEELYKRYRRQAINLAFKILNSSEAAEDVFHDVFLRFWEQPTSYNPQRGRFGAWLLTLVRNSSIDYLRRKRHIQVSLDQQDTGDSLNYAITETVQFEDEVLLKMQLVSVEQAMQKLTDEQIYVIKLAFFNGLTHHEIAVETELPLGTVKSRIRQGLMKLKGVLETNGLSPVI